MSNSVPSESVVSEFREFVKDQIEPVYHFCYFLILDDSEVEGLVVSVFRDLGIQYRKGTKKNRGPWGVLETRILLFQIAWRKIRRVQSNFSWDAPFTASSPRPSSEDILTHLREDTLFSGPYLERFSRIDSQLRAPLVLRDILGFDEEEIVRILELRWAAYRHRLHRARLEFKNQLKGRETGLEAPEIIKNPGARLPDLTPLGT